MIILTKDLWMDKAIFWLKLSVLIGCWVPSRLTPIKTPSATRAEAKARQRGEAGGQRGHMGIKFNDMSSASDLC